MKGGAFLTAGENKEHLPLEGGMLQKSGPGTDFCLEQAFYCETILGNLDSWSRRKGADLARNIIRGRCIKESEEGQDGLIIELQLERGRFGEKG